MLGKDPDLMAAGQLGMLGDECALVPDVENAGAPVDFDRLADQREGEGVAIGVDADQPIVGDDAMQRGLEPQARLAASRHQAGRLPGEVTPDSTLPLVWARYAWHTRGSKLQ